MEFTSSGPVIQEAQDGEPLLAPFTQDVEPLLVPSTHDQKYKNFNKLQADTGSMSFPFNAGKRPYSDTISTFLFVGTLLITYGFGIVLFTRTDLNLNSNLRLSKFNPTTNQCKIVEQQQGRLEPESTDDLEFLPLMIILPICAFVLSFPVGFFFLWLLRHYTRGLVLVTTPLVILIPLGLCVYWLTWCYGISKTCAAVQPMFGPIFHFFFFFLYMSASLIPELWKNCSRNSFEITIHLLKMATSALKEHFFLLILNPVLLLGSMVMVNGPIIAFIWYALNNGKIGPNFDVVNDPSKGCDQATGYPCCQKECPEWFIIAYVILACFTLLWVLMVTIHLQFLVVSGTILHWYFTPTSTSSIDNIKRSLRNAFGPSFETICNMGMIVTSILNTNRQGTIFIVLRQCFSWFPDCLPRFASTFAAISRDSFCESSKTANYLLQRNSLSTTTGTKFVFLANWVLKGTIFVYGVLQSLLVYGVLEYLTSSEFGMNVMIALLCFCATMIGLGQFHQAIAFVIDTVYLCYTMEKDVGEISKPEVCHAFMLLPPSLPENGTLLAGSLAPEDKP